jgi:hypothetical protein
LLIGIGHAPLFAIGSLFSPMTLKSYNLEGERHSGQTLVGNWSEDRHWNDNLRGLQRSTHGKDLTAQPGYEGTVYESTTQSAYRPPDVRHAKTPPRQSLRDRCDLRTATGELRTEELAAEDHSMYFTRGRYLHEPQLHPELDLSYLNDEPITLHSDRPGHNFGKDSHFSQPIQHYLGHRKVKDD